MDVQDCRTYAMYGRLKYNKEATICHEDVFFLKYLKCGWQKLSSTTRSPRSSRKAGNLYKRGVLALGPLVVGWGFQPGDPFDGAGWYPIIRFCERPRMSNSLPHPSRTGEWSFDQVQKLLEPGVDQATSSCKVTPCSSGTMGKRP